MSRPTLKALSILLLATAFFYWKILFTHEFSLLTGYEAISQNYSWLQFWILDIRHGILPLWDPYALAGHAFGGEMQPAAFYPLNLLLALFPFNRNGMLSPQLFHEWFAFTHFLGACFMFALARELGLRRFPSVIAGICFSLGGVVAAASWPDMLHSAIWLPLVFLFLLRAIRAEGLRRALLNAALSGLGLGLAVLAGRLHMVMMQALVVASAVVFAGFHPRLWQGERASRPWIRTGTVLAAVAVVAFCASAVQLLISTEYSRDVLRYFGNAAALPPTERIPFSYPASGLWPHGLLALLMPYAFNGSLGGGEVLSPYLSVFAVLLAVIGIWKRWDSLWVRYLAGLTVAASLYSLGEFSSLYGAVRTLTPFLWMAREASRFMYLADFALALLAAFGVEVLLYRQSDESAWRPLTRFLTWIVAVCAVALAVPALFAKPAISQWISLSILLIFASYGLFRYIIRGHTGPAARFLIVALILFDLTSFNWTAVNKTVAVGRGDESVEGVLSAKAAANFLKSRPGRFRVQIVRDKPPPIGDLFQVPTVDGGMRATLPKNYLALIGHPDLLNARYILKPASASEPGAVYQDSSWKVYENPKAYPAAWVVHQALVERSPERLLQRLDSPEVDLHLQALLDAPLDSALQPRVEGASEDVKFGACGYNRMEMTVRAQSRGLLVLSEMFYPGWRATVEGKSARIYKVDGGLRGVTVPRGESRIVLRYLPWSFVTGAILSLAAFLGTFLGLFLTWRKDRMALPH
jgi:hypothetical protein